MGRQFNANVPNVPVKYILLVQGCFPPCWWQFPEKGVDPYPLHNIALFCIDLNNGISPKAAACGVHFNELARVACANLTNARR